MTLLTDMLDAVIDRADLKAPSSVRTPPAVEGHNCHGCGVATPDVDLWAEDTETGEELWLCEACGVW